ncbi:MAG: hypothetical protein ACD_75C00960G0001, partial [uncultured bacterium]
MLGEIADRHDHQSGRFVEDPGVVGLCVRHFGRELQPSVLQLFYPFADVLDKRFQVQAAVARPVGKGRRIAHI